MSGGGVSQVARCINIEAQIERRRLGFRKRVMHGGTLCSKCYENPPAKSQRYCAKCHSNAVMASRRRAKHQDEGKFP